MARDKPRVDVSDKLRWDEKTLTEAGLVVAAYRLERVPSGGGTRSVWRLTATFADATGAAAPPVVTLTLFDDIGVAVEQSSAVAVPAAPEHQGTYGVQLNVYPNDPEPDERLQWAVASVRSAQAEQPAGDPVDVQWDAHDLLGAGVEVVAAEARFIVEEYSSHTSVSLRLRELAARELGLVLVPLDAAGLPLAAGGHLYPDRDPGEAGFLVAATRLGGDVRPARVVLTTSTPEFAPFEEWSRPAPLPVVATAQSPLLVHHPIATWSAVPSGTRLLVRVAGTLEGEDVSDPAGTPRNWFSQSAVVSVEVESVGGRVLLTDSLEVHPGRPRRRAFWLQSIAGTPDPSDTPAFARVTIEVAD